MADELRVGFIGGGNMARAIADGLVKSNSVKSENITASAITQETLAAWQVRSALIIVFRFCTCSLKPGPAAKWKPLSMEYKGKIVQFIISCDRCKIFRDINKKNCDTSMSCHLAY